MSRIREIERSEVMKAVCIVGAFVIQSAHSHHSTLGLYDDQRITEIEGIVTSVLWRNPHPSYTVEVADDDGEIVEWHVEVGGALSTLRLRGVGRDVITVGDRIRIAGESSTRGLPELFARNILLENGQEVLLGIDAKPRWPAGLRGDFFQSPVREANIEQARRNADGIFRAWSIVLTDPTSFTLFRREDYPLTESGIDIKAQWDPRASPYARCQPRGMPYLMNTPYPVEFVRRGDNILLRIELNDSERIIHMDAGQPAPEAPSLLGYSRGRWEGGTLIVETDRIDAPHFYGDGTPQSPAMRLVEYFTLNEAEDQLDYRLVVSDPATFTEEMEFTRYWRWRPEIRVERFDCQD